MARHVRGEPHRRGHLALALTMAATPSLRLRRGLAIGGAVVLPLLLVRLGGHAGVHMARNLLVPGAGVVDHAPLLGMALAVLAVGATVAWLRWGVDWTLVAVLGLAMGLSIGLSGGAGDHGDAAPVLGPPVARAAHELPLVVLVVGMLAWARSVLGRTPGIRRLVDRRHRSRQGAVDLGSLPVVDRCRAVAIGALAGAAGPDDRRGVLADDVEARARRVGLVARGRIGGDPLRRDHAHARAARLLAGVAGEDEAARLDADARATTLGVPCSEPTWIRPLDGTLAALALQQSGRPEAAATWARALHRELGLSRGHRPAWWWTPLGLGAGSMPAWEHAATTAIARAAGWIDDEDWTALRRRSLGAAARGGDQRDDERLISAARCWLAFVDDAEAARIVARPGVRRDPLACALDALAVRLREDPDVLRTRTARPHTHHDRRVAR